MGAIPSRARGRGVDVRPQWRLSRAPRPDQALLVGVRQREFEGFHSRSRVGTSRDLHVGAIRVKTLVLDRAL